MTKGEIKQVAIVLAVIVGAVLLLALFGVFTQPTLEELQVEATQSAEKLDKAIDKMAGPEACSKITATVKASSTIGVDILGTLTNNCEKKIRYAEIEVACLDASGDLVELDTEYVRDIYPGKNAYFKSPFMASPDQISECSVEIIEADY